MEARAEQGAARARDLVLKRCDDLISWYERRKTRMRLADQFFQVTIVLGAGATSFAAAVAAWPKWAVALPAVITAVATGLSTAFRFRTKYVGFAAASERLKSERLRFEVRSLVAGSDSALLEEFVNVVESIVAGELAEWRETILSSDKSAGHGRPPQLERADPKVTF
ncbi:MAG TPA: DUF4231 domain-containing protein [Longimicrobiales bacterium]|nr:DUF4231 domain-containing protein [Longimicrobiales bacterium]